MAEIINLRQARKRKKRADKDRQAEENRVLHGISGKIKRTQREIRQKDAEQLDGKRLSSDGKQSPDKDQEPDG